MGKLGREWVGAWVLPGLVRLDLGFGGVLVWVVFGEEVGGGVSSGKRENMPVNQIPNTVAGNL